MSKPRRKVAVLKIRNLELSLGNTKLPITTAIFNMTTAHKCPSNELGLCEFGLNGQGNTKGKCYALKAERMYKTSLAFRTRQSEYWKTTDINDIIIDISIALQTGKGKNVTAIRFNESGDFTSLQCIQKLMDIAEAFPHIQIYTYTHRKDLMKKVNTAFPKNLTINLSYKNDSKVFNTFILDSEYPKDKKVISCPGLCDHCKICQNQKNLNISVSMH